MSDPVNHPSHYADSKIEVLEAIEAWRLDFNRGNAVKYIARAGKKNPAKTVEDLEKAIFYIRRAIELHNAAVEAREPCRPNEMDKQIPTTAKVYSDALMRGTPNENVVMSALTPDERAERPNDTLEGEPAQLSFYDQAVEEVKGEQVYDYLKQLSADDASARQWPCARCNDRRSIFGSIFCKECKR